MAAPLEAPTIRDARPGDRAALIEGNAQLAFESEGKTLDPQVLAIGVAIALSDPDRLRYWVAERGGEVIGQAAITREWSDWRNGWVWWFQSVYVWPEYRAQGVFRALFQHIRNEALRASDVIGLRLYVEDRNVRAQTTYRALGMKPWGYSVYEELWIDPRERPEAP
jgi:GNAT superfamily N-acetyltransferase